MDFLGFPLSEWPLAYHFTRPSQRQLPVSFSKTRDDPPVSFGWTGGRRELWRTLELELRCCGGALTRAFLGFLVQLLRLRCGTAQAQSVFDDHHPYKWTAPDAQAIADTHAAARFGALAVDFNLA